ncbi:MAG: putative arabinose efflux permease, MFS family [Verrucomicrobia bacterium]|jgi:MFS family permease|nr:MAG: putative arabinose efflux permease, MFS family [Verrucomicrobiota bacterium]
MTTQPSASRTAWLMVGLLFPVALLNYLDRQMIASMKLSVMASIPDIGNEANWGLMLGKFKFVYAVFSPIGGYIADRFSRKLTICSSLFIWSAITWWTGHVESYHELLWARTLMGISEAFYIPAALALIADFHNGPTRSRAVGIHQMGIYCGVMAGGFAGYVADAPNLGWRTTFDFTGLIGLLYTIPLILLLKNPPRNDPQPSAPKTSALVAARELLSNPSFLLLALYFTLPAVAAWVVRDWMPAILQKSFNISQGKAGVSAALYWQAAALLAAILGGWLADRWTRHTARGRIYVSAIGMALIIPALFSVGNAPNLNSFGLAIAGLVLFGIGWGFFDCNNMPILCQIARPELRATGYGLMNFVSMTFGGVADWIFGILTDRHTPLNLIFTLFATLALISIGLVLAIRPQPNAPVGSP